MNWQEAAGDVLSLYQRWRGTVLNRAGFWLVAAGIGELTSIIQNLISLLFRVAKIPVPFSDPPPWVGFSLIGLGLVALVSNRLLPDRSREEPKSHQDDVKLLADFRALFGAADIEFLTNHDFSNVFYWAQFRPVQTFSSEWVGPRFEFVDRFTEEAFRKVKDASKNLSSHVNKYAYAYPLNVEVAKTKPDAYYEDKEIANLTDERVSRMNDLATVLVGEINSFENIAKKRIRSS